MAIADFLRDLLKTNDNPKQVDVLDQFRSTYPQYGNVEDAELAQKIASKYPDKYGYLKDFSPEANVPRETIRSNAMSEVAEFKQRYPRYKDEPDDALAARMEEVLPEQYEGLTKRLAPDKPPQDAQEPPKSAETPAFNYQPMAELVKSASARLLNPVGEALRAPVEAAAETPTGRDFAAGAIRGIALPVTRAPAYIMELANLRQNLIMKMAGHPELQVRSPEWMVNNKLTKTLEEAANSISYTDERWTSKGQDFESILKSGNKKELAEYIYHQVVGNAPYQIALIGAAATGYGAAGLAGAGLISASAESAAAREKGADAVSGTIDATVNGTIEAAFENLGTLGLFKKWSVGLAKKFGKAPAKEVIKDVAKAVAQSTLGEGNEEFLTSLGQDFTRYATGVDHNAMKGSLLRAVNAGTVGAVSGGAITAPAAVATGAASIKTRETAIEGAIKKASEEAGPVQLDPARAASNPILAQQVAGKELPVTSGQEKFAELKAESARQFTEAAGATAEDAQVEGYHTFVDQVQKDSLTDSEQRAAQVKRLAHSLGLETYQMPKEQYVELFGEEKEAAAVEAEHEQLVQGAALQGLPVPPSVLADYPKVQQRVRQERAKIATQQLLTANQIDDRVAVDLVDQLTADPEAYKAGRGKEFDATATEILGETQLVQRKERLGAVIRLARNASEKTGRHEAFHAVSNLVLTPEENQIIVKKYGDMEKAADAFGEHRQAAQPTGDGVLDRVFAKIGQFLERFRNWLDTNRFETADDIFDRIEQGKIKPARQPAPAEAQKAMETAASVQRTLPKEDLTEIVEKRLVERYGDVGVASPEQHVAMIKEVINEGLAEREKMESESISQIKKRDTPTTFYSAEDKALYAESRQAPTFYSQIEQVVADKMPNRMESAALMSMLKNSPGVKQEEIDWLGLPEFLEGKPVITKAEMQTFIAANRMKIDETVLGLEVRPLPLYNSVTEPGYREWISNIGRRDVVILERPSGKFQAQVGTVELGLFDSFDDANAAVQEQYRASGKAANTKFERYTFPGGSNYRELLISLPAVPRTEQERVAAEAGHFPKDTTYRSAHFETPNVLTHVRFNERFDSDGNRVLFIEEVQSDWHQAGRKKGYRPTPEREAELRKITESILDKGKFATPEEKQQWVDAMNELQPETIGQKVPDAPFRKTWHELAMKRMLRWAAENGYDKVAWTTGAQQNERYDLSKQIKALRVFKWDEGNIFDLSATTTQDGRLHDIASRVKAEDLDDHIGKEMAQKVLAGEGKPFPRRPGEGKGQYFDFEGIDLKVGGAGMEGFYDQILPAFINKYTKKWGGRVGQTTLGDAVLNEAGEVKQKGVAEPVREDMGMRPVTVHSFDLTDAMKESILAVGQPMYSAEDKNDDIDHVHQPSINEAFKGEELTVKSIGAEGVQGSEAALKRMARMLRDKEKLIREEGRDPLEAYMEMAKVKPYREDPMTGRVPEQEEFRQIPKRFRSTTKGMPLDQTAQELASMGLVPEGTTDDQLREMLKGFGDKEPAPRLSDFYEEAEKVLAEARAGYTRVQPGIKAEAEKATGVKESAAKVYTERVALRRSLQRQAYAAARAETNAMERVAGVQNDLIEIIRQQLPADQLGPFMARVGKVQTPEDMVKVVEQVAKAVGRQGKIESKQLRDQLREHEQVATRAANFAREELQTIKKALADVLENNVPAPVRARFVRAMANVRNNKQLAETAVRIDEAVEKYQKRMLINAIKEQGKDLATSGAVAVDYRQRIAELMDSINTSKPRQETLYRYIDFRRYVYNQRQAGRDTTIPEYVMEKMQTLTHRPLADMSTAELADFLVQIQTLGELGRTKLRVREELRQLQLDRDMADILAGSSHIDGRELEVAPFDGQLTTGQRVDNRIKTVLNWRDNAMMAVTPMDVVFDLMDGTQMMNGPNYRIFKARVDNRFQSYLGLRENFVKRAESAAQGLNAKSFRRIGVYAVAQQESGIEKLQNLGIPAAQVPELTEQEMAFYRFMRKNLDQVRPEIARVMKDVYNEDLGEVRNYFPFITDWDLLDDEQMDDRMYEELIGRRKNVQRSFTKARVGAGDQKININAMDVYTRHMDDVAYLLTMGETTKYLGDLAGREDYRNAVGKEGQKITRDWIDLLARKGGAAGARKIRGLDWLRRNIGAATLGFNLGTHLKQPLAILQGAAHIGHYAFQGMADIASRDWRMFVYDNMPEVRARIGDDPNYKEFGGAGLKEKAQRAGFWGIQKLDRWAAASIAAGAYRQYMNERGLKLDLQNPNQDALTYAQRIVRRSQSSPFFKDLPSALTRGTVTGNVSLDKALFQFQNFALTEYSALRHEGIRALARGDVFKGAGVLAWLTLAAVAEIGISGAVRKFWQVVTDYTPFYDKPSFERQMVLSMLQKIPFVSQAISLGMYGRQPAPVLDVPLRGATGLGRALTAATPGGAVRGAIQAAGSAASLAGIPGTSTMERILKQTLTEGRKRPNPYQQRKNELRKRARDIRKARRGD